MFKVLLNFYFTAASGSLTA